MPFVKLDCGMLDSSIWPDRIARELFITALLMAEPFELREETQQIKADSLKLEDCFIPAGWYGLVEAAGTGIIHRAMLGREEGMEALKRLCSCDPDSRSEEHCGKRMARINGGYLILNYDRYRQKDYTTAERSRRYREKKRLSITRDITQAEVDAEAKGEGDGKETKTSRAAIATGDGLPSFPEPGESLMISIYNAYPRPKTGEHKAEALRAMNRAVLRLIRETEHDTEEKALNYLLKRVREYAQDPDVQDRLALDPSKIPMAKNWFDQERYFDLF
jgi:hypothetical protein